jgi:hypothetical protein
MTLSIKNITEDTFDTKSLLDNSFLNKKNEFLKKAELAREKALAQKMASSSNKNSYHWVSDDEVVSFLGVISDEIYLLMIFDKSFLLNLSQKVSSYTGYSWVLTNMIGDWIAGNDSIAKKVLFNDMVADPIKNRIVLRCLISMEELIESSKDEKMLYLTQDMQERVLELSNPEDANIFTESAFEKIRIKAYQKLGPLKYIDKMIEDSSAEVRLYAVNIISPRDQRLAKLVNDRSCRVFEIALSKIHPSLIPMMVGSNHLKKKRVKSLLQQRMASSQS